MERTTILPAAGILLFLIVLGAVALPDRTAAFFAGADARAVRTLGEVAVAQALARARRQVDRDGDGVGEFAFLPELRAPVPGSVPALAVALAETDAPGTLRAGGYLFRVLLPSPDGAPVDLSRAAAVHPGLAAQTFLAQAWPEQPFRTGRRSYIVNQDLLVLESAPSPPFAGPPPLPSRLFAVDPFTGQSTLPPPSPALWTVLLPEAQRAWYRDRFAATGLPLPASLESPARRPADD